MTHEWFLKPKLVPRDRQESRQTTTTTTTTRCQHFLKLTVTQAGFQMKTTAAFPIFCDYTLLFFAAAAIFSPLAYGRECRSFTLQGKGPTHSGGRDRVKRYKGMSF